MLELHLGTTGDDGGMGVVAEASLVRELPQKYVLRVFKAQTLIKMMFTFVDMFGP